MVMGTKETGLIYEDDLYKEVPLLAEEIFWSEDDPRWGGNGNSGGNGPNYGRIIDLENDSYIWCFSGPRGAGKTSYMTYIAEKAAYMYDKRIISNYPIKFKVRYQNGEIKLFESETLEMAKLLMFDESYQGCIMVLDEAPQVINRLATMTWKNRLLDLWIQQIRKNKDSLLYATQNEGWVDNELRWQTDILARCRDASRRYPEAGHERGSIVLVDLIDKSGQWTGYSYDERPRIVKSKRVITKMIWGTFDTYHQNDILESLRRVKLSPGEYQIGEEGPAFDYMGRCSPYMQQVLDAGGRVLKTVFFNSLGLNSKEKDDMGKRLRYAGVTDTGHGRDTYSFGNFDWDRFYAYRRE